MNPTPQPPLPTATPCLYCDDLKAYSDAELSFWRAWQVRLHVRSCAQCREELKMIQTITEELQKEESEVTTTLAPQLRSQILDAARQAAPEAKSTSQVAQQPPSQTHTASSKQRKTSAKPHWIEMGVAVAGIVLFAVFTLTLLGGKVKNTFNKAADSISTTTDGGDFYTGSPYSQPPAIPPSMSSPSASSGATSGDGERRVHKQGSITVAVGDIDRDSERVTDSVKRVGGFIANSSVSSGNGRYAQIEARIPVAKFEEVVRAIGGLGQVRAKNISGEDITSQYVSNEARQATLTRELTILQAQLNALQAKANKNNRDERQNLRSQVWVLRAQTAEAKARVQASRRLAALSSLSISLQEKAKTPAPTSLSQDINKTGRDAWNSFLVTARIPIFFVIYILAYSPIWLPALLLWRRYAPRN